MLLIPMPLPLPLPKLLLEFDDAEVRRGETGAKIGMEVAQTSGARGVGPLDGDRVCNPLEGDRACSGSEKWAAAANAMADGCDDAVTVLNDDGERRPDPERGSSGTLYVVGKTQEQQGRVEKRRMRSEINQSSPHTTTHHIRGMQRWTRGGRAPHGG